MNAFDIAPLAHWVNERHAICLRKCALEGITPPPQYAPVFPLTEEKAWSEDRLTDDPILRAGRFCNVFRELDRVTTWIRENVREPFAAHPDLWFMIVIARFINWPPTIQMLMDSPGAWPSQEGFKPENMTAALNRWQWEEGQKVWTGAFMIRAESDTSKRWYHWPKNQYVSEIVLGRVWEDRSKFTRLFDSGPTVHRVWAVLKDCYGWGGFTAGQVTSDLRHTRYLGSAPDRASWAALGPGSKRGLNRLYGRDLEQSMDQESGLRRMRQLQAELPNHLATWVPKEIELTDIQNCLCETDKYLRVRSGGGKQKNKYVPGRGY